MDIGSREDVARIVAANVKRFRGERGLSQEGTARRADVSYMTVQRAEKGRKVPDWDTLEAIAKALDVSLGDLLTSPGDTRAVVSSEGPALAQTSL